MHHAPYTIQAIMSAWLPVSSAALSMVVEMLPSPVVAQRSRIDRLWPLTASATGAEGNELSEQSQLVRKAIAGTHHK
jgi:hypothetical protein